MASPRPLGAPLCLLAGAVLVVIAALLHPHLTGDGPSELGTIAGTDAWRAIHWAFLFGFVLCLAGLAGIAGRWIGTPGEGVARTAVVVLGFAYAAWLVVVAFMGGAGAALAQTYARADPGLTATRAVFLYDMVRPFALAAQRVAGFALGVATVLFGWAILQGRTEPRWLGWSAAVAGLSGVALALGFGEATRADQAAFVLPVLWQVAAAVTLLARRSSDV
jgi:hypothetical protein